MEVSDPVEEVSGKWQKPEGGTFCLFLPPLFFGSPVATDQRLFL
jgi:hypothetical protein